ncbi:peptide deformylase [Marinibaculum pumilum]|uniref:Peptide deformylase n=1 Tax=Marinibaculum pumilum TaxID=1766165 RepID=A0ABV7L789_9PROT
MSVLTLLPDDAPLLRQVAAPVADPAAPEIARLARDLAETMQAAQGRGIAAPQVGIGLRMIHFAALGGFTTLCNPGYVPLDAVLEGGFEGCLSLPGCRGTVPRWSRIAYWGVTPQGQRVEREADGMHARVVQHEVDHLLGILYPDRMAPGTPLLDAAVLNATVANTTMEAAAPRAAPGRKETA